MNEQGSSSRSEQAERLERIETLLRQLVILQREPPTTRKIVGETFREAGLLILVFVPIYELVERQWDRTDWPVFLAALTVGVMVLLIDIKLEREHH